MKVILLAILLSASALCAQSVRSVPSSPTDLTPSFVERAKDTLAAIDTMDAMSAPVQFLNDYSVASRSLNRLKLEVHSGGERSVHGALSALLAQKKICRSQAEFHQSIDDCLKTERQHYSVALQALGINETLITTKE